ncbi:ABSCISIC ACID-INSENSITIVE 5-like protein 3 [Macadamia integrifolia]|uniref:ABSCISIC ACID-INSENSITIVE 5-like protein 3 n=1 Tax=Macadamia integrifolia TaxID=60698 RepID=UPI001C500307|nr:ABSCISIC ACID-INSENSITIVE 5-like protein 3 [Macadamia integrifolia]
MGFISMVSPNRGETAHFPSLARQASQYLDDVQNQLGNSGKPMNSMNLDELVKSVIAAEQNQVFHNAVASSPSSSSSSTANIPENLNLSRSLSRKTVDEVWKEIVQQEPGNADADHDGSVQRQSTLGETTLEDFLVRAGAINIGNQDGVVNAQPPVAIDPMVAASQQTDWMQFQMAAVQQQQQMSVLGSTMPLAVSVFGSSAVDAGYPENQLAPSMPMPLVLATSAESQAAVERKRLRSSDEKMEKTIERRQKRMIKNRESAARSRARKQAYTNNLENDVAQLKEANKELKKEKEMQMLFPFDPSAVPKYQLRRTSSAKF